MKSSPESGARKSHRTDRQILKEIYDHMHSPSPFVVSTRSDCQSSEGLGKNWRSHAKDSVRAVCSVNGSSLAAEPAESRAQQVSEQAAREKPDP